jgi:DegV family protein with EDD domain
MTAADIQKAMTAGFERLAAWSDLLDEINVFPVADGDTGRNLVVSLAPLRSVSGTATRAQIVENLLLSARGNSGNIAGRFFAEILGTRPKTLPAAVRHGSRAARRAIRDPQDGTMLTFFEALADQLEAAAAPTDEPGVARLTAGLQAVVSATRLQQPGLAAAGVVDAGALGMHLFFEAFFWSLAGRRHRCTNPLRVFGDQVALEPDFQPVVDGGYCIDMVLKPDRALEETLIDINRSGTDVVAMPHGDLVKVHFHTRNGRAARREMAALGHIIRWEEDDLEEQIRVFRRPSASGNVHIVTDAAASLTRSDQKLLNLTLLDSYITVGSTSRPETRFAADELYRRMRDGAAVTTAQASEYERHQFYERLLERHAQVLYLCVGSAYTGNFATAAAWKKANDHDNRFTLIDTGAAAGRLAVIAVATARLAARGAPLEAVRAFADASLSMCREFIFIDRLKYLAAGGRLSRPGAFWGDLLKFKPVVSPMPTGVEKVGLVRSRQDQIRFAVERLEAAAGSAAAPLIWLQYSDNRDWVAAKAAPAIRAALPRAEVALQPLSLTTGVHTGPGTWAVALHPAPSSTPQDAVKQAAV